MGEIVLTRAQKAIAEGHRVMALPEGSRLDVISPNWCDETTWYGSAEQVSDETLTDSGDQTTFNSANQKWIDVTHGKLTGERTLRAVYKPVIKVAGVEKAENSPGQSDGDYTINYQNGTVTFNSSQTGAATATYHKSNGSQWKVTPAAGKVIRLSSVEVQFSGDIELTDTVLFQILVGGQAVAQNVYQTIMDFINQASASYPVMPALGGSGWRGMTQPIHIFRWPYNERGTLDLYASKGMELAIKLENDTKFTGTVAIATLYGVSEGE